MEMLRPRDWAEANKIVAGTQLEVRRTELQLAAMATIESVGPCPPIAAGEGHVVIGRFITRDVMNLVRLSLADGSTIDVTNSHLFWSLDRLDWVAAGELQPGEQLDGQDGTATVADVQPLGHAPAVYNLEVHGQHVYRVAESGVLVHNTNAGPGCDVELTTAPSSVGVPAGVGPYKAVRGHHPLSGKAFDYVGYEEALSIGKQKMLAEGWGASAAAYQFSAARLHRIWKNSRALVNFQNDSD